MTSTVKTSPDFIHSVSGFGGLIYLLKVVFGLLTYNVANLEVRAILSNRLVNFNSDFNQKLFNKKEDPTPKELKTMRMEKNKSGHMVLSVPQHLSCEYLRYLCCCKRDKKFKTYMNLVQMSQEKIDKDLDLV